MNWKQKILNGFATTTGSVHLGQLYSQVESFIPAHLACRRAKSLSAGRWRVFAAAVNLIKVDGDQYGSNKKLLSSTMATLRSETCPVCNEPIQLERRIQKLRCLCVSKRPGNRSGKPRDRKPPRPPSDKTVQTREAVRRFIEAGDHIPREEIKAQLGCSSTCIRSAIEYERGRLAGRQEMKAEMDRNV